MKDILEMILVCLLIGLFFLTMVDLFASVPHEFDMDEFSKQVDFIIKVNPKVSVDDIVAISESIDRHYKRTGLNKFIFMAIAAGETQFTKNAIGKINKNDKGLFQINKRTYDYFHKKKYIEGVWKNIFNIEYNTYVASMVLNKYRKDLKKIFPKKSEKELDKLLIESYNKGVGGVKKIVGEGSKLSYYKYIRKFMEN